MSEIPNECECCPTTREFLKSIKLDLELFTIPGSTVKMWMCPSCKNKEAQLQKESHANADNRVAESNSQAKNAIEQAKALDSAIQLSTDIFNAKTVAIIDIKNAIDTDESITN